jgi:uncharacterized protein YeaO (DUF488 family)
MKLNIKTKSFQEKKKKTDGLRVCVMRRIKPEFNFDIWIPKLAPTEDLLKNYVIQQKITWVEFKKRFNQIVLNKNIRLIELLIFLSKKQNVTLLCWEKSAARCHRSLILKKCKDYLKKKS